MAFISSHYVSYFSVHRNYTAFKHEVSTKPSSNRARFSVREFRPCHIFQRSLTKATATAPLPPEDVNSEPLGASSVNDAVSDDKSSKKPVDPFETVQNSIQDAVNALFDPFFTPLRSTCSILSTRWTTASGNFILRPPVTRTPKAVLHFLGGAFFAAVPQQWYATFLNRLSERGYVIVATPYYLSFDYLPVADSIVSAWSGLEADLAAEYGPLPVIGLGHSAGAVFHTLTSSLFSDAVPKAANILISFNSRPASSAIPAYSELVAPVARAFVSIENNLPNDVRESINDLPNKVDSVIDKSVLTPSAFRSEVLPTARESRRFVEQVPPILREIANYGKQASNHDQPTNNDSTTSRNSDKSTFSKMFGRPDSSSAREFDPSPEEVRQVIKKLYSVRETLVVRFENDSLDDSDDLIDALRLNINGASFSIIQLSGTHVTPLAQDGPDMGAVAAAMDDTSSGAASQILRALAGTVGTILGSVATEVVGALGIRDLVNLENIIDEWVEAAISNGKL